MSGSYIFYQFDWRQLRAGKGANARIGAAKALYFPTFSLTGFLGLESDDLKDFVSASARTWSIGVGLLQPIWPPRLFHRGLPSGWR